MSLDFGMKEKGRVIDIRRLTLSRAGGISAVGRKRLDVQISGEGGEQR